MGFWVPILFLTEFPWKDPDVDGRGGLLAADKSQLDILGIYLKDIINMKCSLKKLYAIKSTLFIFSETPKSVISATN